MKVNFFGRLFSQLRPSKDKRLRLIARLIGYTPRDRSIFFTALRHSSVIYTQKIEADSNERLEFLGDAVLEMVVSEMLYEKFPNEDEGQLTKHRIKLVNRNFLNDKAIEIGIPSLLNQYVGKVKELKKEKHSIYGNALEALIGAIYIDKGYRYARKFIKEKILENEANIDNVLLKSTDYKSLLLSWSQKVNRPVEFEDLISTTPDLFRVCVKIGGKNYGSGEGKRKKYAHQDAAEKTIQILISENAWRHP